MNPLFRMDGSFMQAIDVAFAQIQFMHNKTDDAEMVLVSSQVTGLLLLMMMCWDCGYHCWWWWWWCACWVCHHCCGGGGDGVLVGSTNTFILVVVGLLLQTCPHIIFKNTKR